jgi:Ca2+-binding EF-hand superfamily protein
MRIAPVTAFIVLAASPLLAASQFQRGAVSSVSVEPGANDAAVVLTVRGSNPCRAINIDYGDGITENQTIGSLPATLNHDYATSGSYRVVVRGMTNCTGVASATVRATVATIGGIRGNTRFPNMDRNNDGRITRQEWRGSDQSFRTHDWNGDGVLMGEEIRVGGRRRDQGDFGDESLFNDFTARGFDTLDQDGNLRITRQEWLYDWETFDRVDRNNDNILTRPEFLNASAVDNNVRAGRFEALDSNGNGRIERYEWRGTRDAFDFLDRNNDGVLTRAEVANELGTVDPSVDTVTISIPANERWTDTGMFVRAGDILSFDATGTVYMTTGTDDAASPRGSQSGRRAAGSALPTQLAGALVARVDNSTPFLIGDRTGSIRMPRDGRLYLGVNDDYFGDNRGEFRVRITAPVR